MEFNNYSILYKLIFHLFIIRYFILLQIPKEHILRLFSIIKGRKFLDFCLDDERAQNFSAIENPSPIISVIIPIYNCGEKIKFTIRSVQMQNIKNIEIILVNDFSQDNSIDIIRTLKSTDYRIKIIDNKKNKGTLYSRNLGVLSSKGKYIFHIDNEDMFLDNKVFKIVYKEAFKTKIDIYS